MTSLLEQLGFDVNSRAASMAPGVSQGFEQILAEYHESRQAAFGKGSAIWEVFERLVSGLQDWASPFPHIKVVWSAGKGNWAQIPWISLLDDRVTQTTTHGVYCTYLFRADMSGFYLTFMQGVTDVEKTYGKVEGYELLREKGGVICKSYPGLLRREFSSDASIDLRGQKRGAGYEAATIAHKFYPAESIPDDTVLFEDLIHLLEIYNTYVTHQDNSKLGAWWRDRVMSLRVRSTEGKAKVYKPLLTLLLLARAEAGKPRLVPFSEVENDLIETMKRFGGDPTKPRPEYPFWYLRNDGFWEIEGAEEIESRVGTGGSPDASVKKTVGHVPELYWSALTQDHNLVRELADILLEEYWEGDERLEVAEYFGFGREPEVTIDLATTVTRFAADLAAAGIGFGTDHIGFVRTFLASLATKRFVILTGMSGSGKTQIALKFGEWLGAEYFRVVPVRPDWTGAEALFGYEDALAMPSEDGRRGWAVPAALEFMLKAHRDRHNPYMLILDEMNLAHVERYFADVLSGMESGTPTLPNLERGEDGLWRMRAGEAERISVPKNLFIVGTVNIDETTYMFSPKVLDRANTIEFRVRTEDLAAEYRKPGRCGDGPRDLIRGFLAVSEDSDWHREQMPNGLEVFTSHLRTLHALLSEAGFEFGHRVFFEAVRFAAIYAACGEEEMLSALDRQVMQKVLPRLHGSRRRLEATLCGLGRFCHDLSFEERSVLDGKATKFDPVSVPNPAPKLPISFDKVSRMTRNLRANQFTSFTE